MTSKEIRAPGGCIAQRFSLASPPAWGLNPKNFHRKIIDVAEANQQRWLEESGQWLENVDQTLQVLASGKSVLQINMVVG